LIKKTFDDFNELDKDKDKDKNADKDKDKLGNINDNDLNDDDFDRILIEEELTNKIKFLYPESISNGFNFTVNKIN
jgi:hypothetical protein